MSNFLQDSSDFRRTENVFRGPEVGFGESVAAAYNEAVYAEGVYSLAEGFKEAEQEALDNIYRTTGQRYDPVGVAVTGFSLSPVSGWGKRNSVYMELAEHYENGRPLSDDVKQHVEQLDELRKFNPEVPSYQDIWGATQVQARRITAQNEMLQARPGGFARGAGQFVGFAAGAMNPKTDPLNVLSLGVGGFGKSAALRIASESGVSSLVELSNQLTGVQHSRSLLGLEYGWERSRDQILYAGVAGGVARGIFEGFGAAVGKLRSNRVSKALERLDAGAAERREFVKTRNPYGDDAASTRMFVTEAERMFNKANSWDTEVRFADMDSAALRQDTAEVYGGTRASPDVIAAARAADPVVFEQVDDLAADIAQVRNTVQNMEAASNAKNPSEMKDQILADYDARISTLEERVPQTQDPKRRKRLARDLEETRAQREAAVKSFDKEAPTKESIGKQIKTERARLKKLEGRKDALDKRAGRAIANQSKEKAKVTGADAFFVADMQRRGRLGLGEVERTRSADDTQAAMDIIETAMDDTVEAFQAQAVGRVKPGETFEFGGMTLEHGTKITDPDTGKEMSLNDLMKDFNEDDALLEAAAACKVRA